ncbi:hypothetical protein IWW36_001015 [Coemansia brasiliensis]|uniref:Gluconokinase n=1 Tax=Coemansia brasiliensis TaxID=2650707 RepID=A0A9W8M0S2_9FUNG|nr:hypothetical protein IWW36_001015 [Coemansia brasiliensis]
MRVEDTFCVFPVRVVVVMGVSGCGKTTIGMKLAHDLNNAPFIDADGLHPPQNVEKMAEGIALIDSDRWPWLARVRKEIDTQASKLSAMQKSTETQPAEPMYVVCGCSALKRSYRELLSRSDPEIHQMHDIVFVYIDVGRQELVRRVTQRKEHFFNPSLLDTQLDTLEPPDTTREAAIVIDGSRPVEQVVADAYDQILNYRPKVSQ